MTETTRLTSALAGRYAIERELGQGGMATVYLARDIRHDRNVALKVLRPELAAILGGDRFLAEIKTTANLQHPHILSLFDSGDADGLVYYVMPYVEGESLRDRLTREHQLPVDEAVRIAREVLDALQYAHDHQIVHRDIKPENILLHGGHAMVADFGIALAAARSEGGTRMTETGMSLGTPAYMAPEQAMGEREITPRADLYAVGAMLYEMLTGEPPFTGPTAQAIVARMMTESPRSLTLQRHTIAPNIEAAVGKALEKLPADRFATATEFLAALGNPAFAGTSAAAVAVQHRTRRPPSWAAVAALALSIVAVAGVLWLIARPAPAAPVRRYGLALPQGQVPMTERRFAISPDGATLAFVAGEPNATIWIKESGRYEAEPIAGAGGSGTFVFSPDGQWIAYAQGGSLKKVPIHGGAAITLTDSVGGNAGLTWGDNNALVFIGPRNNDLRMVRDVGGPQQIVWHSDTGTVRFPVLLPGGKGLLFDRCIGSSCRFEHALYALDLKGGAAHVVQPGAALGLYSETGHVLYVREDGGMFALPFDAGRLRARGTSVPVLDSVSVLNGVSPLVALSKNGTLVVRPGGGLSSRASWQMVLVDRQGRQSAMDSSWTFVNVVNGGNAGWSLSPDGRSLAIGLNTDAGDDIWVKQLPRGPTQRLSFDSTAEFRPRWEPDGRSVDYISTRSIVTGLFRRPANGTGQEEQVLQLQMPIYESARTPDGQWLVVRTGGSVNVAGGRDIYAMHLGVDSVPKPLLASKAYDESAVALSPDGHWIAYESDESGRLQVYVRPFPNVEGGKWQISINGGSAPGWARNGREVFFMDGDRNMVSAAVTPGASLIVGERHTLFRIPEDIYQPPAEHYRVWEITPDGRFMMARRYRATAAGADAPLIVAENWFTELRQKVGR